MARKRPEPDREAQRDPAPKIEERSARTHERPEVRAHHPPAHRNVTAVAILATLLVFAALTLVWVFVVF